MSRHSRARERGGSPHVGALTFVVVVACTSSHAEVRPAFDASRSAPHSAASDTATSTSPARTSASAEGTTAIERTATNERALAPKGAPLGLTRTLAVSGYETAVIVVPPADRAAPLLVATHGAGGSPEWECERWGRVARGRWFLACPRGTPLRRDEPGSDYYADHPALEREVLALVDAVRAEYGTRVAPGDGVYLGYSQGATMGALMLVEHGALFPHLVLVEGGSGDWTLRRAERFRETGGRSVFIVCGTEPCARRASASAPVLERAGVRAVTSYAAGAGHTELGAVGTRAEALLETLDNGPK